jgi:hypothetical protein
MRIDLSHDDEMPGPAPLLAAVVLAVLVLSSGLKQPPT